MAAGAARTGGRRRVVAPDPGLFGPDSVTWRVHADPLIGLAGLRALLLQALHPVALAGVVQHSDFRADPWGRLLRTAAFVGAVSFGTTGEARAAARRVRAIHRRLSGVDPDTGERFPLDQPELLLWVHCCEVDSFLVTFRRCGGQLSPAEADRYFAEQVRSAELVGLDPRTVPDSQAAMADYFRRVRPQLRADAAARRTARFVLLPPMPGRLGLGPARPAWLVLAVTAVALLPGWARRMYGLPGLPTTDLASAAVCRSLHLAVTALPARMREGPHLAAARERLGLAA